MAAHVDVDATALFHNTMPFTAELGIEALHSGKEEVSARLGWAENLCTLGGVMHGGVLMSLADSAAAVCAYLNLPDGAQGTTTIESKTNFLRTIKSGSATAVSSPLHVGRRVIVVETEIRDDERRLVAKVTQTQGVL
ncbi:MAG: hotdog fold thioesterase [Pseudonocardiaceae bacterium]|nr:hotdog fold thioesterase [Pseudonocardiaceae bacterium]